MTAEAPGLRPCAPGAQHPDPKGGQLSSSPASQENVDDPSLWANHVIG
ncbi:hypothetical protein J5Y04_26355 [Kitasatospora sp. RG8]|nr:hypothetical protein [Kitasatospora sp. RG8]MBP0453039.1 hypothetical protein [Kitasatospora sp. RG8]